MSLFSRLDWVIAWRHLRKEQHAPPWVLPMLLGSIYVILVGALLWWHAASITTPTPVIEVTGPFGIVDTDLGPTPQELFYREFGRLTLGVGLMFLTFAVLSWFFNLLPTIITMSVLLGCMALVVVLSLMSGLEGDLRDKILNQKAHIRVSRADARPFSDYRELTEALSQGDGLAGASPYLEGEIMVRSGLARQGALVFGIIPTRQTTVSNLDTLVKDGDYAYLDRPQDIPNPDPFAIDGAGTPWRLRHLETEREKGRVETDAEADAKPEPVNKLPDTAKLAPDSDPPEEYEDDEGWEDPAAELQRIVLPRAPAGVFGDLPKPQPLALPEPEPEPDDDGWEDPASEIKKLRDRGELPPEADSADPGPPVDDPPGTVEPSDTPGADEAVENPILIGRELSMELGVRLGDPIQLITPVGRTTPAGQVPGVLAAKVAGVFFSGMYEYDRKNVYGPLDLVQKFLLTGDRVSGIEVKLDDVDNVDAGKAEVERIVAASGRGEELLVEDWRDLNRNLFSAMFLEKVAMFIALLFVVLVASFGILASNLMSVMEKAKEIAILKAMGTGDAGILRVFIAEGLCVGILGSFGGIAMGLGLCWQLDAYGLPLNENVYYIEKLPVVVNPAEVALVGVAALVIVCISSLYPALVASRLRPVDALRQADQ